MEGRIENLVTGYQAWRCYRSDGGKPKLSAQRKLYFTDPLLARLPALRNAAYREPDETKLAEQQIGLALARALEYDDLGSLTQATGVLYERTKTDKEIEFVGPRIGIAFEVKYGQSHWRQEARTVEANHEQSIMATAELGDELQALGLAQREHRRTARSLARRTSSTARRSSSCGMHRGYVALRRLTSIRFYMRAC